MPNKMTLEAFQSTAEYRACRPQSQVWLTALVTNGFDYVQATTLAYPTRNTREKARVFSHAVRNWPKVAAALNLYLGRSPVEVAQVRRKKSIKQLVGLVKAQLAEAEPGSVAAQRLLAQLQSLMLDTKTGLSEPESQPETSTPRRVDAGVTAPQARRTVVPDSRIPADALKAWVDVAGVVIGYRAADGTDVQF